MRGFQHKIHLINLYAPYRERMQFWNRMEGCGFLLLDRLIIVEDFNCSLDDGEIWGEKGQSDPLAETLSLLFQSSHL